MNVNYAKYGYRRIQTVAPSLVLGSPRENAKIIANHIKQAANENCLIVCFPELSVTGYSCEDLFVIGDLVTKSKTALRDILSSTQGNRIVSVIGAPFQLPNGAIYNCAIVCFNGKILGVVPKCHLPNYSEFYEKRWFASGYGVSAEYEDSDFGQVIRFGSEQIFKIRDTIFAVEICEDLWAPIPPSSKLALMGAQIIFNLSASNELVGKHDYRVELVKNQSARLNCAYAYVSCGPDESTKDIVFGGAHVVCENGSVIGEIAPLTNNKTLTVDVDISKIQTERAKNGTFTGSILSGQGAVVSIDHVPYQTDLKRSYSRRPFVPSETSFDDSAKRCDLILAIQATGLARRLKSAGLSNLVLGLSGGLDSALAFLVSLKALDQCGYPRSNLKCLTMPGYGTTPQTLKAAHSLAKGAGAEILEISIVPAMEQHFKDIGQNRDAFDITFENSQARERTQLLFDYANKVGGIVVGTGDLSELALGWCTFNGDHMSNYNVNASIPKTLVKTLIRHFAGTEKERELKETLEETLGFVISPELVPPVNGQAQSTEDKIGTYELNDFFLFHLIRNGFSPEKIYRLARHTFTDKPAEKIKNSLGNFYRRFFSSQFKRSVLPAGPKVGSVSLSPRGDWRMPDEADVTTILNEISGFQE